MSHFAARQKWIQHCKPTTLQFHKKEEGEEKEQS